MFNAAQRAKHEAGLATGRGEAAVTELAEAKAATDDMRAAEAETPLDADREYFKRLCGKHSSCELRSKYRGYR
jgi:hypothetical protein